MEHYQQPVLRPLNSWNSLLIADSQSMISCSLLCCDSLKGATGLHQKQLHLQTVHPEAAAFSQLSDLPRASSWHTFLAALNHSCAQTLPADTEKLPRLEALSQPVSLKTSVQSPLPERPQLLPHRPRPAADIGHDLLLVLDVLKDLLWVMALSLLFTNIVIRVAGSPAHAPREEKENKLFPWGFPALICTGSSLLEHCNSRDPRELTWPYFCKVD